MKTLFLPRRNERGSTLLIAVVALATLTFLLVSYMNLCAGVNRSVTRSQVWNDALSVAEAGVEEAMIAMNINGVGGLIKAGTGWDQSTSNRARVDRWLTYDTTAQDYRYYYVLASTNSSFPVITSYGACRLPGAYGNDSGQWIWRTVEVTCTRGSRHPRGMLAQGKIDMNGQNATTDSYDSTDPTYSTNGRYDAAKRKQNGDIGTNLTVTNSVSVGQADIYGSVATGPGGTVTVGANGFVTGNITSDMNVDFPDVVAPFTTAPGLVAGTNYTYVVPPGNTLAGSVSLSGSQKVLISGPGLTKLYLTGSLSMAGNSLIEVATNASLELYIGGASTKIAGNGILNNSGKSTSVSIFGLPGNTSVDLSGNASFTGTIYAPNAAFTAGGGGNNTYDLAGAIAVKTITLNGHFNLHYDEALGRIAGPNGLTITSWREL